MNLQKIMSSIIVGLIGFSFTFPVYATNSVKIQGQSSARVELHQEIKASKSAFKQEIKVETKNFRDDLKEKIASQVAGIKRFFGGFANIRKGKVTAKTDTAITVDSDGKIYTVDFSSSTKLRRKFFGVADYGEIQVGDLVNVIGKWKNEEHTIVEALLIRDLSIMKRFGVFVGVLKAISGNTWTLDSVNRGTQSVTVSSDTKFYNRKNETITQSQVQVNDKIRVKGLWDKANNTITDVVHVKDYNLPLRVKPTATVTATIAPTVTPSSTPSSTPTPTL